MVRASGFSRRLFSSSHALRHWSARRRQWSARAAIATWQATDRDTQPIVAQFTLGACPVFRYGSSCDYRIRVVEVVHLLPIVVLRFSNPNLLGALQLPDVVPAPGAADGKRGRELSDVQRTAFPELTEH